MLHAAASRRQQLVMRLRAWRAEDEGDNTAGGQPAGRAGELFACVGREADGEQEKPPVAAG